ncbi:putative nuclease HARBI1 [Merluccius polli]|uniref:Nuclease HARBI1 n=1 Tax=Merluccius polli TaxID=89951 RepID=A0AA47P8N1_MERPO|nr:putative nuclease HARBI1 [Merluccius polli]
MPSLWVRPQNLIYIACNVLQSKSMMVNNTILADSCTHGDVTTTLSWDIDYCTVSNNVPTTPPCFTEVKTCLIDKEQLVSHGPICLQLHYSLDKTKQMQHIRPIHSTTKQHRRQRPQKRQHAGHGLNLKFIRFPLDNQQLHRIKANFMACRYAGVVGAVDGTHIQIIAPSKDEDVFVNRKNVHSINTQIVSDATFLWRQISAKMHSLSEARYLIDSLAFSHGWKSAGELRGLNETTASGRRYLQTSEFTSRLPSMRESKAVNQISLLGNGQSQESPPCLGSLPQRAKTIPCERAERELREAVRCESNEEMLSSPRFPRSLSISSLGEKRSECARARRENLRARR